MKALTCARYMPLALCSLAAILLKPVSSLALPGGTFQQAEDSIRSSTLFQGVEFPDEQAGLQNYSLRRDYDGGEAVLYLYVEDSTVRSEALQFRYPNTSISFERAGGNGLELIEATWGEIVAQDFAASRYTDVIEEPYRSPSHFYLGERYGYKIEILPAHEGDRRIYTFVLMEHSFWEDARQLDRFCVTNPNHNDCLGL